MGAVVGFVYIVLREIVVLEVEVDYIIGGYWSIGCIGIFWFFYVVVLRMILFFYFYYRYL